MNKVVAKLEPQRFKVTESEPLTKGLSISDFPWFTDYIVLGGSSVFKMKFSTNKTRYGKPSKCYLQCYDDQSMFL